jgi:hypothetical protein
MARRTLLAPHALFDMHFKLLRITCTAPDFYQQVMLPVLFVV